MVHLIRCLVIALLPAIACASSVQETGNVKDAASVPQEPAGAGTTDKGASRQAALEQRVNAKWDALIRGDFAAAYAFASPAYRRSFSLDAFRRNFGDKVVWKRIEVVSVVFQGDDAATVGIKIYFVYHDPQSQKSLDMSTHVQESWILADGEWWYLVKG
jgi:hypothetical protein